MCWAASVIINIHSIWVLSGQRRPSDYSHANKMFKNRAIRKLVTRRVHWEQQTTNERNISFICVEVLPSLHRTAENHAMCNKVRNKRRAKCFPFSLLLRLATRFAVSLIKHYDLLTIHVNHFTLNCTISVTDIPLYFLSSRQTSILSSGSSRASLKTYFGRANCKWH